MPASSTRKVNKKKTGVTKPRLTKADHAKAQHVPQFINSSVATLEEAADKLTSVYMAYNDEYYKDYGLTAARAATRKALETVDKAVELSKKNKFYDEAAGPWTGVF